jgi:hypothetical protein
MAVLLVPPPDVPPWPTLGPQVCDWIEANLVYGPGDLRGAPYTVGPELRGLIYRAYEVRPDGRLEGRRRFRRVAWSLRKGVAKTEAAALIAICEAHPDAPVRFDGWDAHGRPVGRPVDDPYIPMVAYTVDQSEELAYGAVRAIIEESAVAGDFDVGLERVLVLDGRGRPRGKIVPLAGAPNARDGPLTPFQVFDETHRLASPRLVAAHRTMLANLPKRKASDPWALEVTTSFEPGAGSIAERTHDLAVAVAEGRAADTTLCYFRRWASDSIDISDRQGLRDAVAEASGPHAAWSDLDGIAAQFDDPEADLGYLQRVWLNRIVAGRGRAFTDGQVDAAAKAGDALADGDLVVLGFDGSKSDDATALVATRVSDGFTCLLALWERPHGPAGDGWEVPRDEPDLVLEDVFARFEVARMYGDPRFWESDLARWSGRWQGRVREWPTNEYRRMGPATRVWHRAVATGEWTFDGGSDLARHLRNVRRRETRVRDADTGALLWVPGKESQKSPLKIDAAVACVLAWQARIDAQAAGAGRPRERRRQYRAAGF